MNTNVDKTLERAEKMQKDMHQTIDSLRESIKNDERYKKLNVSNDIHSAIIKIITEAYGYGNEDGYGNLYNSEFAGEDKSKQLHIEGLDNAINKIVEKYNI